MNKWQLYAEAKRLFDGGENVSATLRDQVSGDQKRLLIEAVYDLQAGSYTESYRANPNADYHRAMGKQFAEALSEFGIEEVFDCGIGEATSWLRLPHATPKIVRGFDISLSRISYALDNLDRANISGELFVADLYDIPVASDSGGCVVTMHAIEPNGGMEQRIIDELARVAGRYLILMEPDYARANAAQRERMERLGYARDIFPILLGRDDLIVHRYDRLEIDMNPQNRASLIVAEKKAARPRDFAFMSPISGGSLRKMDGFYYDDAAGFAFPIIGRIPALKKSDALFYGKPHPGHRAG